MRDAANLNYFSKLTPTITEDARSSPGNTHNEWHPTLALGSKFSEYIFFRQKYTFRTSQLKLFTESANWADSV